MIRNIVRGYRKLLGGVARGATLLAVCAAVGCAVVLPLWKFATAAPEAYTVVVLALLVAAAGATVMKKCRAIGKRRALRIGVQTLIVLSGLCGSVALVLHGRRLLALIAVVATVGLYGLCAFGTSPRGEKA